MSGAPAYSAVHSETVGGDVNSIVLPHFSFSSNDSVIVDVTATNGAGGSVTVSSLPYSIDFTPPHANFVYDGRRWTEDLEYQSQNDQLFVTWDVLDDESGVTAAEVAVYELREGRRMQVYPSPLISGETSEKIDAQATTIMLNLMLNHGSEYFPVITFTNGAGLVSRFETNGIVVDTTPPTVNSITVQVDTTIDEQTGITEQTISSTEEIIVRWRVSDAESGVASVLVGVVDENFTYVSPGEMSFVGEPGGRLVGLDLTPFAVYRVAVVAVNHAGEQSQPALSDPFRQAF